MVFVKNNLGLIERQMIDRLGSWRSQNEKLSESSDTI